MKKLNLLFTALLLLCCVGTAKAEEVTIDGIKYDVVTKTKIATVIKGGNYSGDIVIPETIEYNGVNYSVSSIGDYAFYSCSGLTSVVIPNSVTSIGVHAFTHCRGLTSVVIGDGVTIIDYGAFYCCSGLTSIEIPNSVTNIENGAFSGCDGHTSIRVAAGNTKYDSRDNCNAIIETATNTLVAGFKKTSIPNSVTSIGEDAFHGCKGLTSIEIPNSVTSIGKSAFYGCSGLTSVVIPNSVTSIGQSAFRGCTELTSVVIPNSVTSIGNRAFDGCTGLTSIEIPNSVTSIGDAAFSDCSGLTSVVVAEDNPVYDSRNNSNAIIEIATNTLIAGCKNTTIPNSVTSIGNYAFSYRSGLTSIEIPNSVTSIGNHAFYGCRGLTSIEIPNSVTSIGNYAFNGCNNIEKLYIGSSVESIGSKAFAACEKITEIKVALEKPIRGSTDIFADAVYDNATLYIPNGTKSLYKKREPWNIFFDIVEMDFTGIDEVFDEVKGEIGKVKTVYDLNGRAVENPTKGMYIINGKKVFVK